MFATRACFCLADGDTLKIFLGGIPPESSRLVIATLRLLPKSCQVLYREEYAWWFRTYCAAEDGRRRMFAPSLMYGNVMKLEKYWGGDSED
jgi:hypothetical protein